jgi:proteasome lid subunit RPN8/RPN11
MLPVHTGKSKADCLAKEVSALLGAPSFAEGIVADALSEQGEEEILKRSLTAERILDFSVSQAVTLQLSKMNLTKPCTSIFMTRDGQYLVSLSEGPERSLTVGDLETQLAAACLERRPLREVLATPESTEIRYSGACSAHTTVLPQDVVAVHAGIASQFVKALPTDADASIVVWHLDPAMQTLDRQDVVPSPVHSVAVNGWQVRVAHRTLAKLRRWRRSRLPNETGGVLLGTFDMVGKVAYVSAALPSPPDSREWPICYIRGVAGLSSQVQSIMKLTGEHLSYVGEWHSHPDKCGPEPSPDDKAALVLLAKDMGGVGLPAIMVIVGESGVPHVGLLE